LDSRINSDRIEDYLGFDGIYKPHFVRNIGIYNYNDVDIYEDNNTE